MNTKMHIIAKGLYMKPELTVSKYRISELILFSGKDIRRSLFMPAPRCRLQALVPQVCSVKTDFAELFPQGNVHLKRSDQFMKPREWRSNASFTEQCVIPIRDSVCFLQCLAAGAETAEDVHSPAGFPTGSQAVIPKPKLIL